MEVGIPRLMQFLLRLCPITDKVSPRKCHASICNHHALRVAVACESDVGGAGLGGCGQSRWPLGGRGASAEKATVGAVFSVDARAACASSGTTQRRDPHALLATGTPPVHCIRTSGKTWRVRVRSLCPLLSQRSHLPSRHQPTAPPARSPLRESKHNSSRRQPLRLPPLRQWMLRPC